MRRLICWLRGHRQLITWKESTKQEDVYMRYHKCSYCGKTEYWREY